MTKNEEMTQSEAKLIFTSTHCWSFVVLSHSVPSAVEESHCAIFKVTSSGPSDFATLRSG
jgi:hypothetical protein